MASVRCFSLETCRQKLDAGAMFGNAPRALWRQWVTPDADNLLSLACRCLLADTGRHRILFEAGLGRFMEPALEARYGITGGPDALFRSLERAGYAETDIDMVVLSHLHFDHAGGLVSGRDGRELRFPEARYVVSQAQFERAAAPGPRDRASYIPWLTDALAGSGRLVTVPPGAGSVSGLPAGMDFFHSDGHTPGMLLTRIRGAERTLLFGGDLLPGRHWLHLPIVTGYDRFAERSVEEKQELLQDAFAGGWTVFFPHDPAAAAAGVVKDAKGRYCAGGLVNELAGWEL